MPLPSGATHSSHFNSGFESEFSQFGTALTSQIVSLPLPPPASGFTYEFDPGLGVFTRTSTNFGPILSERAETIGARRVSVGFAYQRLSFDSIEGVDLRNVPAVFTHDDAELLGGREDVVTTVNSIGAEVSRTAMFISYGVTNQLDVSIAVPIITADIVVTSDATIQRIGTTNPETHFFRIDRRRHRRAADLHGVRQRVRAGRRDRAPETDRQEGHETGRRTRHRPAFADWRGAQSARHRRAGRQPVRRLVQQTTEPCRRT